MSKKSFRRVLTVLISLFVISGSYILGYFTFKWSLSPNERAVLSILDAYEKYYYFKDEEVVDIISDAIFDDYSTYYSPEEYEEVVKSALGQSVGVGLTFLGSSNAVYGVIVNSPCYHQGVTAGGTLVSVTVNGVERAGEEARDSLSNTTEGQEILLKIDYGGTEKVFTVTKKEYNQSYVTYRSSTGTYAFVDGDGEMVFEKISSDQITKSGVGYIKYSSFNGRSLDGYGSYSQMKKALDKFSKDGNSKLIFDLRGNGGGYLDVASSIGNMLVEGNGEEKTLQISVDRDGKETRHYFEPNRSQDFEKIIVLVDKNTASASEALVGALLDYDDKDIVTVVVEGQEENGQTTYKSYGKGIMQTTYKNRNGSAVRVTTAKIFWPVSRTCIHGVGITTNVSAKVQNAVSVSAYDYALSII